MILTALSFISLFRSGRIVEQIPDESKAIAKIGGKKITVAAYINEINTRAKSIGKMTDKPYSVRDMVEAGLLLPQLNQMVSRIAMEAAADDLKLAVDENEVREIVKSMPMFAGPDGSFDIGAYKKYLNRMGLSEKRFIDDTFLDLRTHQLTAAAGTLSLIPQSMAATDYALKNEKRDVDLFTIKTDELKIAGTPSAEEKERLYKEMTEELTAPEYRSFTVMYLTLEDVSKRIDVSEDELQEYYDENKALYTIEEKRDVDQMLFDTEDDANKAYQALQDGQDFMTVAKKFANQTEDQTKLGDMTPSTATGDWADIVFNARKGEIIAPVQTAFGWQVLRVNKITPKIEKKFKTVRNEIKQGLVAARAFDTLSETAVALDDRFGAGETIEEVAGSTGFPVKKFVLIDPAGLTENGKPADISKTVLNTAFMMDTGKESPMVEDGTGFFVLRVDDIVDPAVKPIEKAEKEIYTAWLSEKQKEQAKAVAETIQKGLKKGTSVNVLSKKTGAAYSRLDGLTRYDTQLPASLMYRLFNQPEKSTVVQPSSKEYMVARVVSVTSADSKKNPVGVEELRRQMQADLATEKANAVLADYAAYLGMQIDDAMAQKAFSFLTKSVQEKTEEDE